MNAELRKEAKNDSLKDFFQLINNSVFEKVIENVQKHKTQVYTTCNNRKKQQTIQCQNQIIIIQSFDRKFVGYRI